MGTTAQKLQAILDSKSDIKDAIEAKGVTVGDAPFDQYASKINAIPTPIEEAPEDDVNFYDYTGFRVASYTIAEAKALTALPTPPSHNGLTFQEWNWSLADIQSYNRRFIDIGANYVPTDGKCHIKVHIKNNGDTYMQQIGRTPTTIATSIDWGDGTIEAISSNTPTHQYTTKGDYDIKIYPDSPTDTHYLQITFAFWTAAYIQYFGMVKEINIAPFNTSFSPTYLNCLISLPTYAKVGGYFLQSCKIPMVVFPKDMDMENKPVLNTFIGMLVLPKTLSSLLSGSVSGGLLDRSVLPETTDGSSFTTMQNWSWCQVLSLPASINYTGTNYLQGFGRLRVLDIVQGWIPTNTMNLSSSNFWLAPDLVDFFTKLGTTSTTITITLGSNNLNKLTAEQKAIATGKGYTLA